MEYLVSERELDAAEARLDDLAALEFIEEVLWRELKEVRYFARRPGADHDLDGAFARALIMRWRRRAAALGTAETLAADVALFTRELEEALDGARALRSRPVSQTRELVETKAARERAARALAEQKSQPDPLAVHIDHNSNVLAVGPVAPIPDHEDPIQLRGNS